MSSSLIGHLQIVRYVTLNSFKDQYPTDSSLWNTWWEAGLVCIRIYLSAVVPGRKLREIETTGAGKVPLKSGKWPTRRLIARDNSILQLCFSPINPFDLTFTGQTWNLSKNLHDPIFGRKNFTHWKRVHRDYFRQQQTAKMHHYQQFGPLLVKIEQNVWIL